MSTAGSHCQCSPPFLGLYVEVFSGLDECCCDFIDQSSVPIIVLYVLYIIKNWLLVDNNTAWQKKSKIILYQYQDSHTFYLLIFDFLIFYLNWPNKVSTYVEILSWLPDSKLNLLLKLDWWNNLNLGEKLKPTYIWWKNNI